MLYYILYNLIKHFYKQRFFKFKFQSHFCRSKLPYYILVWEMDCVAGQVCIPGERLSSLDDGQSGAGTYTRHGYIFASLAGIIAKNIHAQPLPVVSVVPRIKNQSVPEVGAIATCKITQISSRFAKCLIIAVNNHPVTEGFRGMIRKENVRETERDRVDIYKSFRPGDVVLAKVLSLGDAMCYQLTTAENELGVVIAHSEDGSLMVPLTHQEMQCPSSLLKESRKVARPQSEHLIFSDS